MRLTFHFASADVFRAGRSHQQQRQQHTTTMSTLCGRLEKPEQHGQGLRRAPLSLLGCQVDSLQIPRALPPRTNWSTYHPAEVLRLSFNISSPSPLTDLFVIRASAPGVLRRGRQYGTTSSTLHKQCVFLLFFFHFFFSALFEVRATNESARWCSRSLSIHLYYITVYCDSLAQRALRIYIAGTGFPQTPAPPQMVAKGGVTPAQWQPPQIRTCQWGRRCGNQRLARKPETIRGWISGNFTLLPPDGRR